MSATTYKCNYCGSGISFQNRRPFNADGSPHRCKGKPSQLHNEPTPVPFQATMFAMQAMNAIIAAQIQQGGIDHIHHMNFYDVADAAWRASAAMVHAEKNYRQEFGDQT